MARPPKLDAKTRRLIRVWYRVRSQVPTRRDICAYFGITDATLSKVIADDYKVRQ